MKARIQIIQKEDRRVFVVEAWNGVNRIKRTYLCDAFHSNSLSVHQFWVKTYSEINVGPLEHYINDQGILIGAFEVMAPLWYPVKECATLLDAKIERLEFLRRKNEK